MDDRVARRAFAAACLGIALFAGMDAAMKGLSIAMGAYSAMLWRAAAGIVVAGVPWLAGRPHLPGRAALHLHVRRGAVTATMAVAFFWGLARVPMAEAVALTFIAPLVALFLASLLLGERVPRAAIVGSGLAFAGVMLIVAVQAAAPAATRAWAGTGAILFSALCYAYNLVLQRRQALAAPPLEIAFFQALTMCGFLAAAAPLVGVASPAGHWPALILSAGLAAVSILLLSWAYARAEASYLVPAEYTAFVWACLLGWAVFGEPVGPVTLAGTGLIVAGCLVAMRRPLVPVTEMAL